MKTRKYLCPICRTEMNEYSETLMRCPKCSLSLSKSNYEVVVYCPRCNKLYADTTSYNDHLLVCEKENKRPNLFQPIGRFNGV